MESRLAVLALALLVPLMSGCFKPNYGSGGFSCTTSPECPGGYVCVSRTCKPASQAYDAAQTDQGTVDRGARDRPATEGRVGDRGRPEQPRPDGRRPDLGPREGSAPDGPVVSGCTSTTVAKDLKLGPQSFDLVLDNAGDANVFYVSSSTPTIRHISHSGLWVPSNLPGNATQDRVAATVSPLGAPQGFHVVVRNSTTSVAQPLVHYHRDFAAGSSWAWQSIDLLFGPESFDIAPSPGQNGQPALSVVGTRPVPAATPGTYATVRMWKADLGGNGQYAYPMIGELNGVPYTQPRAAAGPGFWGYTLHRPTAPGPDWFVGRALHGAAFSTKVFIPTDATPAPLSIAFDSQNGIHLAGARAVQGVPTVGYAEWDGTSTAPPIPTTGASGIRPASVDLAMDGKDRRYVSWVDAQGNVMWASPPGGGPSKVDNAAQGTNTRLAVDPAGKKLHLVFDAPPAQLKYVQCAIAP